MSKSPNSAENIFNKMLILPSKMHQIPQNAELSYSKKQTEFKTWMLAQHFAENIIVPGKKIHSYQRGDVCGRKGKNVHC